MEQFNSAHDIQRTLGDNRGLATTLNFLTLALWKLGLFNQGLDCASESVDIKKKIMDYRARPGGINVMGDINRDIYKIDKAIEYHTKDLGLAREHNNKGAMCDNIRDLGADYLLLGDFETALKYFDEVLELSKVSGLKWYETKTYNSLADFYLQKGDKNKAKHFAQLGMSNAEKLNAEEPMIEAFWVMGKIDEDTELFQQAIKKANDIEHMAYLWQLYSDFSQLLEKKNQNEGKKKAVNESKKILQTIIGHFQNNDLKQTFLKSKQVSEVINQ